MPCNSQRVVNPSNNFVYRTGALGGLHLYYRVGAMPFGNNESLQMSAWEIVLEQYSLPTTQNTVNSIIARNANSVLDLNNEVERVIEYLVSTVSDI